MRKIIPTFGDISGIIFGLILFAQAAFPIKCLFADTLHREQKALKLSFLIRLSLKNPGVTSSILRAEGSKEDIVIAKTLPEPLAGFGLTDANGFNNPEIGVNSMSALNFSATQSIPFPLKLYNKARIKKYSYLSLMQKSKAFKLNTEYLVKKGYYGLALVRFEIVTIQRNRMLLKEILGDVSREYGTGTSSAPAYIRMMLEDASLKSELYALNKSERNLVYILSELTGLSSKYINRRMIFLPEIPESVKKTGEFIAPNKHIYKDMVKKAYEYNPDLKSLKYLNKESRRRLILAKEQYLPDFYIKLGYGDRYSMVPVVSAAVGVSLPVYFNGYQRPLIAKAEKESLSSVYGIVWEKLLISKRVKTYINSADTDLKNYRLYKNLYVPEAMLLFKSESDYFGTGKASAFSLINSFKKLIDAEFRLDEFRADYFINLARLNKIEGASQNNINSRRNDYENIQR